MGKAVFHMQEYTCRDITKHKSLLLSYHSLHEADLALLLLVQLERVALCLWPHVQLGRDSVTIDGELQGRRALQGHLALHYVHPCRLKRVCLIRSIL